jgi:hypothetical protein
MKKITYILSLLITSLGYSQIGSNNGIISSITNSNVLLDGSTNFSTESGAGANTGKGVIIPSVDLVNFEFDLTLADSFTFPTFFDGMIVYNNASNNTLITGNRSSTSTAVTPGFYYFSNPNGATSGTVTSGVWTALGSTSVKNIGTTEIATSTSIDGKQVYALTGTFTADTAPTVLVPNPTYVSTAVVSITKPTGFTGYFKMTTYTTDLLGVKKTFRSDVSSLTVDPLDATKLILVTGNGLFSEVYPGGEYTYILEFFKA